MEQAELDALQQKQKRQLVKLTELSDLTDQLAQAVDRRDAVSVKMLLSMRQEPVQQLQEMHAEQQRHLLELPQEDAIRMNELLQGAEPENEQERPVCEDIARCRRLLGAVLAADRRLSLRLGGNQSFYKKFRES